jgi:tetratricopeptide (TPR) repeat protein
MMSISRTKYALTPRESSEGQVLTPRNLREIAKFIESNKKLNHHHRSGRVDQLIPKGTFEKIRETGDSNVKLSIAPVHPKESALDVPLRFTSPEQYHLPGMTDPRSNSTVAARILLLLKGASQVPVHWEGEQQGTERDVAKMNALRDAEIRVRTAHRAHQFDKEAHAYCAMGALHYNSCTLEKAIPCFNKAVQVFEQIGEIQGVAFCHNILGVCHYRVGEYKLALLHHKKQEVLSSPYGQSLAEINLGVCYSALNELHFAELAFSDALANAMEARDPVLETIALGNLGLTYMRSGDLRKSQVHMERCLEHCSIAADKVGASVCLLLLGEIYSIIDDMDHALFYYEHAFRVAREAQCTDIAEIARVSIGVSRGHKAIKETMTKTAKAMGNEIQMRDLLLTLPQ